MDFNDYEIKSHVLLFYVTGMLYCYQPCNDWSTSCQKTNETRSNLRPEVYRHKYLSWV